MKGLNRPPNTAITVLIYVITVDCNHDNKVTHKGDYVVSICSRYW